jgi:arginine:ornithine antiporter/lysine permease
MCAILFTPGIVVFWLAKREHGEPVFRGFEWLIAVAIVCLAVLAGYLLKTGVISPF